MSNILIGRVAPVFKGEWNNTTTYERLDVVRYMGSSYVLVSESKSTNERPTDYSNKWIMVAEKGEGVSNEYVGSLINELKLSIIGTCNFSELDLMGNMYVAGRKGYGTKIYQVVNDNTEYVMGLLFQFGDSMGHGITQIFYTNTSDMKTKAHTDGYLYTWYRYYNFSSSTFQEVGRNTWTDWKLIESELKQLEEVKSDLDETNSVLEDIKTNQVIGCCQFDEMDSVGNIYVGGRYGYGTKIYQVKADNTNNNYIVGLLFQFGDSLGHGVTQIFYTNTSDMKTKSHSDGHLYTWYRYYNYSSTTFQEVGRNTWTDWKLITNNSDGSTENVIVDKVFKRIGKNDESCGGIAVNWENGFDDDGGYIDGTKPYEAGEYSVNLGHTNQTSGYCSFSTGFNNVADGDGSHAMGVMTKAQNMGEISIGFFNISKSESKSDFGLKNNTLFSIGNGDGMMNQHNAFQVMQNGDVYIADTNSLTEDGDIYEYCHTPMISLQNKIKELEDKITKLESKLS